MFDKALLGLPGIGRIMALLCLLAGVQAAAVIGEALSLGSALSHLWHGSPLQAEIGWIGLFLACFLGKQAITCAQDALLARYAQRQVDALRRGLLESALGHNPGWVRAHGTAGVADAALEGIDQVENYLRVALPKTAGLAIVLPAALVATFALDWVSGVVLVAVIPAIVFYMVLLGRMAKDKAERQYGRYRRLANHFVDTLRGLPTLKAFGASKRHAAEVFQVSEDFREATDKTLRVATLSAAVLDLLATLGVAAVAMLLGFRLVDGSLELFVGLAVLVLAPECLAPLRDFAGDFHATLDGRNALAHILELLGEPADGARRTLADDDAGQVRPGAGAFDPWNADSTLELVDAGFSYPADDDADAPRPALQNITFEARGFQRIGIVGESGCGKSTLAALLGGFLEPESGNIRLDGHDAGAGALAGEAWRRQVLYIPQDPHIFHDTLRNNICFYTPNADAADVDRAVSVVGLDALVAELPEGLDTVIGQGGRPLSGGQAQRIALARALLDTNRRILVFDEPTAHLDIETELELKERMLPLMEGRLVFFATHRLHWLENMDRVLVLDGGRIVEERVADAPRCMAPGELRTTGDSRACKVSTVHNSPGAMHLTEGSQVGDVSTVRSSTGSVHLTESAQVQGASAPSPARDTWVRPYFRRYRKVLASALGLGVAAIAFAALLMFTAGYLISATAEAPGSILFYYLPIAFVQVFGLGKPPLRHLERLQAHDWVFRMTSSLRVRLYKALELSARKPTRRSPGEVLGLVSQDIGHIQNLYLRTVFPLAVGWIVLAIAVVAMAVADPLAALALAALLGTAAVALPLAAARRMCKPMHQAKEAKAALYESLTDDLLGASDWVFSGRGGDCTAGHMATAKALACERARIDRFARGCDLAVTALLGAAACGILAWAAWRFGGTTAGAANWIAALVLGYFPLAEAFAPLSRAAMQANEHRDAITRLNGFPDVDDSLDASAAHGKPARALTHDIFARNVAFRYPGNAKQVLDGVNLSIPAGQHVAVLGRSGSGKSTLAMLLRGDMKPDAGFVAIGGKPAAAYGDGISQLVGVVEQDAYLFDRSLRDNLAIARPDAADEELWEALAHVKLDGLVRTLPQGLDTMADEAGMRFSGGERHRIALARVLLANTPIVLLDEATVGLDAATEQGILDTLLEAADGRTLIVVTHHLQGVEAFDRVVFLEDGRIELDGAPAQLAAESERYRRLLAFDGLA